MGECSYLVILEAFLLFLFVNDRFFKNIYFVVMVKKTMFGKVKKIFFKSYRKFQKFPIKGLNIRQAFHHFVIQVHSFKLHIIKLLNAYKHVYVLRMDHIFFSVSLVLN